MEVLLFIILFLFFILEYRFIRTNKSLSFSLIFLVSYFGLFIVPIVALELYESDILFLEYFYNDEVTYSESKRLITIVLLHAFLGTYLGRRRRQAASGINISGNGIAIMPIVNLMTGVTFLIYILMSGDMIFGEYTPLNTLPGRTYVYRLFFVLYNIGLIMYLFTEQSHLSKRIFKILMVVFLSLSFYIGDRGPLVVTALYFCAWASRLSIWNFRRIFVVGFVGIFLLGIIGEVRSQRHIETSLFNRYSKSLSSDVTNYGVGEGPLFELASSTRCLTAAIQDVKQNDIKYGFFHSVYFTATIPFLSNIYLQILGRDPQIYGSSSSYFTYLIQGRNPGYGNGTNIIADLYIDFGEVLTYLIVFSFFFYLTSLESKFYRSNNLTVGG